MKFEWKVVSALLVVAACSKPYNIHVEVPSNKPLTITPVDGSPEGVGPGSNIGGTPAGGFPDPTISGNPANPGVPTVPPGGEVCDPFKDPSDPVAVDGPQINGKLYTGMPLEYYKNADGSFKLNADGNKQRIAIPTVNNFFIRDADGRDVYAQPTTLFFSNINAPERIFSEGFFNLNGEALKQPGTDTKLTTYFAMSLASNFKLSDNDEAGQYQFATVSDDGSNLYINNNGASLNVMNDTEHYPRLSCATETVSFSASSRFPFRLDYYQGPPQHIALVILWRKIPAGSSPSALADPKCGMDVRIGVQPGESEPSYGALFKRGWKVLQPGNFELSKNAIQPPESCKMRK